MKIIKIIGTTGVGKDAKEIAEYVAKQKDKGLKIIFIPFEKSNVIEIEGVKYRKKEVKCSSMSPYLNRIAIMASMFESLDTWDDTIKSRQRPDVDILTEYQLVLAKKSDLSKSDRDWVQVQFKKMYEIVL